MAECELFISATYGSFRVLDKKSYLKKYPCYFKIIEGIEPTELKKMNTTDLAEKLRETINNQVDEFRKEDLEFIQNMKINSKRKELETRVDARVKS